MKWKFAGSAEVYIHLIEPHWARELVEGCERGRKLQVRGVFGTSREDGICSYDIKIVLNASRSSEEKSHHQLLPPQSQLTTPLAGARLYYLLGASLEVRSRVIPRWLDECAVRLCT